MIVLINLLGGNLAANNAAEQTIALRIVGHRCAPAKT
jgi:hypothetical protein